MGDCNGTGTNTTANATTPTTATALTLQRTFTLSASVKLRAKEKQLADKKAELDKLMASLQAVQKDIAVAQREVEDLKVQEKEEKEAIENILDLRISPSILAKLISMYNMVVKSLESANILMTPLETATYFLKRLPDPLEKVPVGYKRRPSHLDAADAVKKPKNT